MYEKNVKERVFGRLLHASCSNSLFDHYAWPLPSPSPRLRTKGDTLRRNTELDIKTAEIPKQTTRNVIGFSLRSTTSAVLSADRDNDSNHLSSTVAITLTGSPSIVHASYLAEDDERQSGKFILLISFFWIHRSCCVREVRGSMLIRHRRRAAARSSQ
jgi:hypothetical protein